MVLDDALGSCHRAMGIHIHRQSDVFLPNKHAPPHQYYLHHRSYDDDSNILHALLPVAFHAQPFFFGVMWVSHPQQDLVALFSYIAIDVCVLSCAFLLHSDH